MTKSESEMVAEHHSVSSGRHTGRRGMLALSVGALGVVYGDIGTSPLYALNLMFFGHDKLVLNQAHILGGISLVIWALTIVVAIKYALLVLRADSDGEGGVFALYALLEKGNQGKSGFLAWSLLIGAGLLFGDGIITPAISVLSATEGIGVAAPLSGHAILATTMIVLTLLFAFQYRGTGSVGRVFGPVLILWFVVIAALGMRQIIANPEILRAFDPRYAVDFLMHNDLRGSLFIVGALMLVLTGGEAMYADMGHFGAGPIRLGWFGVVFPALLLNYLGQGAFLLGGDARIGGNLFYSMVPIAWLFPMVILATLATVIASQALISGAFSLTSQSIALGLLPRLKVRHTHRAHAGQVYVPFINWMLYIGCISLVLTFGSSDALGSAYGLAVSGVMLTTSVAMYFIARRYWGWGKAKGALVFGTLALIDAGFLLANTLKFWDGGYIPLSIGMLIFLIMLTWHWGRQVTFTSYADNHTMSWDELIERHRDASAWIDRTAILMVPILPIPNEKHTPTLLQMLWNSVGLLPRNLIFLQVQHPKVPYIHEHRYAVTVLARHDQGSILLVSASFGFMEEPNIEHALSEALLSRHVPDGQFALPRDLHQWVTYVALENFVPARSMSPMRRFQLKVFTILRNISRPAYYHYGMGERIQLAAEIFPVHVK